MNYSKKNGSNRLALLFADKGFYIILILCVAAIGISGYVLFFSDFESDSPEQLAKLPESIPEKTAVPEIPIIEEIPEGAIRETEVVMSTPKPEEAESALPPVMSGETEGETVGEVVAVAGSTVLSERGEQEAPAFFVWPLNGQILKEYSVDALVPSATMGDWRVHTGLDIGANKGTQVAAIADGSVEDIYTDEMMGVTVVIAHGGDMKSVYQNLSENPTVKIGEKVKAGDVLGAVGSTAASEELDSPHLHLEVIMDGANADPRDYLPNK